MTVTQTDQPIYLSPSDVATLAIRPEEVASAVMDVLREYSTGGALQGLKTNLRISSGSYFQALPSILMKDDLACLKWISVIGSGTTTGVAATVLLTTVSTGRVRAVLDGAWITATRTAAMTAIAAKALAKPQSSSLGFVGCGVQALSHLEMIASAFQSISRVTAFSRSRASAERLCAAARARGLQAEIAATAKDSVAKQDIVVTTVSASGLVAPFLDAAWLEDGAFASLVDLGRSWLPGPLRAVEFVATDDAAQSTALAAEGKLAHPGPYVSELAHLAAAPPLPPNSGRRIFIFGGMGICDAAVAALCLRRALVAGNVGTPLPDGSEARSAS